MEIKQRKSVVDNLSNYDPIAKDSDFIEVTEWVNGEGWDINLSDKPLSLTFGELEAINYLTKALAYQNNKEEKEE